MSLLAVSSCSFRRPADLVEGPGDGGSVADDAVSDAGGDDAMSGDAECQLTAISPSIANTNAPITLEGTFNGSITVNFPGGTSVTATFLGPHRASVRVPADAAAGDLTATTCGATLGPLPFRRASFSLGVGSFADNFEQTTGARQYPVLVTARASHTTAIIGPHLYVLGGTAKNGSLTSIEHALINADGTIGRFEVSPVTLTTPRQSHASIAIGSQLYVIGGFGDRPLDSVEHSTISSGGTLGPFTTIPAATLTTPRQGHAIAVIGNYLYVLGGVGNSTLNSVERATIGADGSLSKFRPMTDIALATPRHGHTATVIGNYLYIIGGAGNSGALKDIERATINPDGTLGTFAAAPSTMLGTARSGHTAVMIGTHLYVFGGVGNAGSLSTVERCPVDDDGSLGSFETAPDTAMLARRHDHTMTAVGNYLYIVGGADDLGLVAQGEHATINASGGLGSFTNTPGTSLTAARADHAGVVLGNYFYIIGGIGGETSIERAVINPDNSLSPFIPISGVNLMQSHDGHSTAVIGSHLYVLGGGDIERAAIDADGSIGSFEEVGIAFQTARKGATATIAGDYLYIIGGNTNDPTPTAHIAERTLINADDSLAGFETLPGLSTVVRNFHTAPVIGDYMYILGGDDITTGQPIHNTERALFINHSLGMFEAVPEVTVSAEAPSTAVIGSYLYTVGIRADVERALIAGGPDRVVGPFTTIADITGIARSGAVTIAIGNFFYTTGGSATRVLLNQVARAELK